MESDVIINRVELSALITFNLEDYYLPNERVVFDITDQLFMGMVLKEKDFRAFIKMNNWESYQDKLVSIICSADAIVPTWAYMLLASKLLPYAKDFVFGDLNQLELKLYQNAFQKIDFEQYRDKKLVIKGCGQKSIPNSVYVLAVQYLQPIASSIMYGEPCSTVPVYKKK